MMPRLSVPATSVAPPISSLAESGPSAVVCFSTANWDAPLWTNKQHLMSRLAQAGFKVLYIDSLGLRRPGLGGSDLQRMIHRLAVWRPVARRLGPLLWRDTPLVVPLHRFRWARMLNDRLLRSRLARNQRRVRFGPAPVAWLYNPLAAKVLPGSWPIVYHCVDDLAAYPGIDRVSFHVAEVDVARRARVCIASSRPLVSHLRQLGATNVVYWPNPADVERYAAVVPSGDVAGHRPLLGFIGAIQSHKVDIELIAACALLRPDWQFELVGPVGHGLSSQNEDAQAMARLPGNVRILPPVDRAELPKTLSRFSVGLIPYRINRYTESVFPMKLFEYLASGLPVVSTPLPSLVGEVNFVAFASTPASFVDAVEQALRFGRDPASPLTIQRQDYALAHSWTARVHEAVALLQGLVNESRRG